MKNLIIAATCVTLLALGCKKADKKDFLKNRSKMENANARFSPPDTDEDINEKIDSFEVAFTNYMEHSQQPTWDTMFIDEVVWTLEATANRTHTPARQYTVDTFETAKHIFYITLGGRDAMGEYYARPHNIFYCYDSIASAIANFMNGTTNLFYAIDVEVDEDVSEDLFKMHVEIIAYAPILEPNFEPTNFGPGDGYNLYPYYNQSAYHIEKKLTQYFTYPPLYSVYYTNFKYHPPKPNPNTLWWVSIIDHTNTTYPGYSTLDYFGSTNLRWLWSNTSNVTLNYNQLNQSLNGLKGYLTGWQTTYNPRKIMGAYLESIDYGSTVDTSIPQSSYGCYPDNFRYYHVFRWTSAIPVHNPNYN